MNRPCTSFPEKVRLAFLAVTGLAFLCTPLGCGDSDDGTPQSEAAAIAGGQLTINNYCDHDLIIRPNHTIATFTLDRITGTASYSLTDVGANQYFYAAVKTTDAECSLLNCVDWGTTLQDPRCHTVAQWSGDNLKQATYCNPVLASAGACAQGTCCGANLIYQSAWGSLFEIDINTPNDSPDMSTNSNCECSASPNQNQCLTGNPIFFNVPYRWSTNQDCSAPWGSIQSASCLTVDCPHAYTYPTDSKQVSCPHSPDRGYLLEFCPDGNALPAID